MRIIVTTCPAYAHLLDDFDYLFQKFWGVDYTVIGKDKKTVYAEQWDTALRAIDDEYFIMLHEDFYIVEPVDTDYINLLLEYAKEDNYQRVSLQCVKDGYEGHTKKVRPNIFLPSLHQLNPGFQYMCSLEASIWHRETFLKVLRPGENVWQTEVRGSIRNPNIRVLLPEEQVVVYHDARIHGHERMKVINGTFHKIVQGGDGVTKDVWLDLGIKR